MQFFSETTIIRWADSRVEAEKTEDLKAAVKKMLKQWALFYGGWWLAVVGLLAVLSFTNWLGGPYLAAEVIFYLIVASSIILVGSILWVWYKLKASVDQWRKWQKRFQAQDTTANEADGIHDVDVITEEDNGDTQ